MENNYQEQIAERIENSEKGSMFITSDFSDSADTNVINQALFKLHHFTTFINDNLVVE